MGTCEEISNSITELDDEDKLKELIENAVDEGIDPDTIIEQGIRDGLENVGQKYEKGTYFLSELTFAGDLVSGAMKSLEPYMKKEEDADEETDKLILGTVERDIHDIGKNIFKILVSASGFEVIDLGVDVSTETFVENVEEEDAIILGMSSLLTTTTEEMEKVIKRLEEEGLRKKVKIILGGNAVSKEFGEKIGADAVAKDAFDGVKICKRWSDKIE